MHISFLRDVVSLRITIRVHRPMLWRLQCWTRPSARRARATFFRASIARVCVYVPDARTAAVLMQHAMGHVKDACSAF
jgi:hypothetical protein